MIADGGRLEINGIYICTYTSVHGFWSPDTPNFRDFENEEVGGFRFQHIPRYRKHAIKKQKERKEEI